MTATFSPTTLDTFNRADGGLGPNWLTMTGQDAFAIDTNQVKTNGSGNGHGAVWATLTGADCEASIEVPTKIADSGGSVGVLARVDLGGDIGYGVDAQRDGANVNVVIDAYTSGNIAGPYTVALDDGDRIGIRCVGNLIEARYYKTSTGWVSLGSVSNTATPGGGYIGFYATGDSSNELRLDNFGGGDYAWTAAARSLAAKLEVDWDKNGTYTDESAYLLAENGARGTCSTLMPWQLIGGTQNQPPWTATFVLDNASNRYSATNASGPYYANIRYNKGHGIPARFSVGIDDGAGGYTYTQIFQGYIDTLVVNSTVTSRVTMNCVDNAQPLLQSRKTTTLYLEETASSWLTVLATLGSVGTTSLDPGRCIIPFAWLDDEQLWAEMNKVAHADGGLVYFNQAGTLVFENCETWITLARHTVSQYTFTVSRWEDMAPAFSWADVYNEVVCQFQPRALRGRQEVWVYEQADRQLLPGEVRTIEARLRYPCAAVLTPAANVDFRIVGNNGDDLTGSVTVTDFTVYAQRCEIELTNASASRVAYIHSFRLIGVPLYGYPAGQVKLQATGSDMGDPTTGAAKTLVISGNEYIQTLDQAQLIAASLRDRVQKCRLTYRVTNVPGIPNLIPGDLVTVVEAGSGVNATGYIIGYNWQLSRGAFDFASVDILDATSWTPYSAAQYFLLGTDTLAASNSKRAYY